MSYNENYVRQYPPKEIKTVTATDAMDLDQQVNGYLKAGYTPYGNVVYSNGMYVQQVASYHASYSTGPR
jgi:hypothetical protein